MKSIKRAIYEEACKRCLNKEDCDKFLKLDFKLKKCKTSKCRKLYKRKITSLKKSKKRSKKKKSRSKKDGFIVDFPVTPFNTCKVWKGF
jgi:hypothetical protein